MLSNPDPDHADFGKIVSAHEAAVRAYISVRLDDPFEAHDLAQEVFLLLWKKIGSLDLDRPLRPWLLGVAANLIRRHRRKGRAIPVGGGASILDLLNDKIDEAPPIDGPIFAMMEECLTKLVGDGRKLIESRYVDGLGIAEICRRDGSKHSSVTMKLFRLRATLQECIESRMKEAGV